jgi:hypothetical protein
MTSEIPFASYESADGVYYTLDVDPVSFRIIISVVTGKTLLDLELSRISKLELVLLRDTAQYLLCDDIASQVDKILNAQQEEVTKWTKKLGGEM